MDIQKEREAFEGVFPCSVGTALNEYGHYESKINQQDAMIQNISWVVWQAAKAKAVPEGFVVVPVQCPDPDFADMLFDELSKNAIGEFGDDLLIHFSDIDEEKIWDLMLEAAQEPANTEITIRCTNCGLEFESDYDLEQNLIDPETGEIHDGCPTCETDAHLMDLIKYPVRS